MQSNTSIPICGRSNRWLVFSSVLRTKLWGLPGALLKYPIVSLLLPIVTMLSVRYLEATEVPLMEIRFDTPGVVGNPPLDLGRLEIGREHRFAVRLKGVSLAGRSPKDVIETKVDCSCLSARKIEVVQGTEDLDLVFVISNSKQTAGTFERLVAVRLKETDSVVSFPVTGEWKGDISLDSNYVNFRSRNDSRAVSFLNTDPRVLVKSVDSAYGYLQFNDVSSERIELMPKFERGRIADLLRIRYELNGIEKVLELPVFAEISLGFVVVPREPSVLTGEGGNRSISFKLIAKKAGYLSEVTPSFQLIDDKTECVVPVSADIAGREDLGAKVYNVKIEIPENCSPKTAKMLLPDDAYLEISLKRNE
jgi:hypothetical protein